MLEALNSHCFPGPVGDGHQLNRRVVLYTHYKDSLFPGCMSPISRIRSWSTPPHMIKGKSWVPFGEYPRWRVPEIYQHIPPIYGSYHGCIYGLYGGNIFGVPKLPLPGYRGPRRFRSRVQPRNRGFIGSCTQRIRRHEPWFINTCDLDAPVVQTAGGILLPKTVKNGWEETLEIGV